MNHARTSAAVGPSLPSLEVLSLAYLNCFHNHLHPTLTQPFLRSIVKTIINMPPLAATSPPPELVGFFSGTHKDRHGRSLADMIAYSDEKLERRHDYIQTLFPLPERSAIDLHAPIIDESVFNAFRSDPKLKASLLSAFHRILEFYGFELDKRENGTCVVKKGPNFGTNPKTWNRSFDHNHLRITRIIRCLRVLGLQGEALAFHAALIKYSKNSTPRSREYWRRAAFQTLNMKPDDQSKSDCDLTVGRLFLRKYEEDLKAEKEKAEKVEESQNGEGIVEGDESAGKAEKLERARFLSPGPPRKRSRTIK
ncbi:hypothetical protein HYALB_00000862 [Hymenoscyphus albidus]|uniref:Opioid growth factor receptor (OGFr) conserved domain-containing protein n=1 Tax=Hymenoscyphus albidus TaxID=595503 RepID=A0A9N9LB25_9HELO|nr:hypothetical protein HYALB_00000862 [Hymenoscyphus albidus]